MDYHLGREECPTPAVSNGPITPWYPVTNEASPSITTTNLRATLPGLPTYNLPLTTTPVVDFEDDSFFGLETGPIERDMYETMLEIYCMSIHIPNTNTICIRNPSPVTELSKTVPEVKATDHLDDRRR